MRKISLKYLEENNAYYKSDSEFTASARLLQSKWRETKGLPKADKKLGNFLPVEFAKATKANFPTDRIKALVQYEVYKAKAEGSLISEPRIWNNLLSSQPLCFNLFGEMHFDLKLACKYFAKLFPNRVEEVTAIKFEYSPGRGNKNYTGDHSAFDVFVKYNNTKGKRGFIGIEVKYAENLREDKKKTADTFKKHKRRYLQLSNDSKIFPIASMDRLKEAPMQQIWRDHLLAIATIKDYDEGCFVYLFPSKNIQCQNAIDEYISLLNQSDEGKSMFLPRHLEIFIDTLRQLKREEWTKELQVRYLGVKH